MIKRDDIPVIFEDEGLMVINKPAGLVVDPSNTQQSGTLAQILSDEFHILLERGGIVHRLDKDTSGLLVVAKTAQVLENLQTQFKERIVKKTYLALVHGMMSKTEHVEGGILRNPANREKFILSHKTEEGKNSETDFEPIGYFHLPDKSFEDIFGKLNKNQMRRLERNEYGHFSLVHAYPLTGRTHQIRVHLKYIGFPIVGDEKYAGRKTGRLDKRWCPRQFLHAQKISFNHPLSGESLSFEAPLARDLQIVLEKLIKDKV